MNNIQDRIHGFFANVKKIHMHGIENRSPAESGNRYCGIVRQKSVSFTNSAA